MLPDDPRHGFRAGGRVHRKDGEPVCEPCRRAEARYQNVLTLEKMAGKVREVPAIGTQRRLRALVAIGHSQTHIGVALGVTGQSVWNLVNRELAYTRTSTAAKIARLYDEWSMRLPDESTPKGAKAAKYARTVARKRGWAPPLAWDDSAIDDPDATPYVDNPDDLDPQARRNRTRGRLSSEETVAEAEWLADSDESLENACARLNISAEAFYQTCRRTGRLDLYARLSRRGPDGEMALTIRKLKQGAA